jgi:hypothetical protein
VQNREENDLKLWKGVKNAANNEYDKIKKCFDKNLKKLLFVCGKQVYDDGDEDVGFWCVICKRH